jgi:hypothetical protein
MQLFVISMIITNVLNNHYDGCEDKVICMSKGLDNNKKAKYHL